MKYHIWKLGVVFTDNVSMASEKQDSAPPGSGMSLDATGKQARKDALKDAGIAYQRWRALKGLGDYFSLVQ